MSEMVLRQYEKEPRNFIWKIITALICVFPYCMVKQYS